MSNSVVDKYHKLIIERIDAWKAHAEDSQKILNAAIDPASRDDYQTTVKKLIGLGLNCYDQAFELLYPGASAAAKTPKSRATKSKP